MTVETLDQARERLRPAVERAATATGWSFPIHSRKLESRAWDYDARAFELISQSASVLDIGTGGGERFGRYCQAYTGFAVASEGWHVNAPIAQAALSPLGINVVFCDDERLPFRDPAFDLVLNRHSGFAANEIARVLTPGGTFYTEQVWGHWRELRQFFPRMPWETSSLESSQSSLRAAGLTILDARVHVIPAAFASLADFVFMLCVAGWTIPNFEPLGADLPALLALERELTTADGLILADGAYLLEAIKPA